MRKRLTNITLAVVVVLGVISITGVWDNIAYAAFKDRDVDFYLVPAEGASFTTWGNYPPVTHVANTNAVVYFTQPWFVDGKDDGSKCTFRIVANDSTSARDGSARVFDNDNVIQTLHYLQCGNVKTETVTFPQTGGNRTITLPYGYQYSQYGSLQCVSSPAWLKLSALSQNGDTSVTFTISADATDVPRNTQITIQMGNTSVGGFDIARISIDQAGKPPEPSVIRLNPESAVLDVNANLTISANIIPSSVQNDTVTWTSSNTSVATVNGSGSVKALQPGSTTITARTSNGLTAACAVTVKSAQSENSGGTDTSADIGSGEPQNTGTISGGTSPGAQPEEPKDIKINPSTATIEVGASISMNTIITPSSAQNTGITWISSDTAVASVTNTGFVTGKKPGSATITARTSNGLIDISAVSIIPAAFTNSPWAEEEIAMANDLGLIPEDMRALDLRNPISRMEFAAISVKTYEALSDMSLSPAADNPFTDTNDIEVLKAYNAGISIGVSSNKYDPYTLLNREQAATMLTRVFKKIFVKGWSIDADESFTLQYVKPELFADDARISDWAKDSVYFMTANEIIKGTGDNMFSPRAITDEEEAMNYAAATREQALAIAVRMVNKWSESSEISSGNKD